MSHTIIATIEVPQGAADGVLVAEGGTGGGFTLYIKNGKPIYEYNFVAHERYKITSSETLSPGSANIRVDFKSDGGIAKGADVVLFINDKKVGEGRVGKTVPFRFGGESFDVGMDNGSPVSADYEPPFAYTGTIKKIEINIKRSGLTATDQQKVRDGENGVALGME